MAVAKSAFVKVCIVVKRRVGGEVRGGPEAGSMDPARAHAWSTRPLAGCRLPGFRGSLISARTTSQSWARPKPDPGCDSEWDSRTTSRSVTLERDGLPPILPRQEQREGGPGLDLDRTSTRSCQGPGARTQPAIANRLRVFHHPDSMRSPRIRGAPSSLADSIAPRLPPRSQPARDEPSDLIAGTLPRSGGTGDGWNRRSQAERAARHVPSGAHARVRIVTPTAACYGPPPACGPPPAPKAPP